MNNWTYIDDVVLTDNVEQIHVDTRDFHVLQSDVTLYTLKERNNDYIIEKSQILDFIKKLETISGGRKKWRILMFNNINDVSGWDCKYIRFYKISNKDDNKFVVCLRENQPVKWRELTEEHVMKEYSV